MDYKVDINQGVDIPLPDYCKITNTKLSSEEASIVKVSKENVGPHTSAIKIMSDPKDYTEHMGVLFTTRYHMSFDGSIHFSVLIPNDKKTVFGFVWRY